jgi:hypothetical protein
MSYIKSLPPCGINPISGKGELYISTPVYVKKIDADIFNPVQLFSPE